MPVGTIQAANNTLTKGPLTARLKKDAKWNDSYPAFQDFADECERLLDFGAANAVLDRFWPRLCSRQQQRDEALNELRVAHHLETVGFPVVDWNEPKDAPGYNVEYSISLGSFPNGFVEVKSPGWEAELSEAERKQGRAKLSKYIGLRGGAAGQFK